MKQHAGNHAGLLLPTEPWYGWEEEEDGASWLLSYVDMLSVVLALMVVLLGQVAARQMTSPSAESPVPVTAAASGASSEGPLAALDPASVAPPVLDPATPTLPPAAPTAGSPDAHARLAAAVEERLAGLVQPTRREHGVSLAIADAILFESGQAELREAARPLLALLVDALQEVGEAQVAVEGHTDSRPIHGGRYLSNWELAAARATAVTRFLIAQGFAPDRLRSVSYADTRPVAHEDTPAGYAQNRRVNLLVEFPASD